LAYLWLSIVLNKLIVVHFETHRTVRNSPPTDENISFPALGHYIDENVIQHSIFLLEYLLAEINQQRSSTRGSQNVCVGSHFFLEKIHLRTLWSE